ncbi:pilus assembly protein [Legionella sp. W05-934-2]|uniref:pilus assembly protein n=1 Tax=Legionella sp. W05-934-2 TaxID=1198649 RepID=UPI0034622111
MKRWFALLLFSLSISVQAAPISISQQPLFITQNVPPLTMLIIERDHKLYFEAYNDASDIDGDGQIDFRYKPNFDYLGYFDSYKCYQYSDSDQYFYPVSVTANKTCSGAWSGNFLNYITTARIDAIRKILYGGYRAIDNTNFTVLQRSYIPQEGHSWGKEYSSSGVDGYNISDYTPFSAPSANTYHLFANTTLRNSGSGEPLMRVALSQPYRIWQWVSIERPVAGSQVVNDSNTRVNLTIYKDYVVRVVVCDNSVGLEPNCQPYPNGEHKPVGLLQEFGENDAMMFGLITGSYENNLNGGVVRKNISSITDEIDANTGQFTTVVGIIATLNKFTTPTSLFQTDYSYTCGWITTRDIGNGECEMWGAPLAEMMYEAVRYFAGKGGPTSGFSYSGGVDGALGLPQPGWVDPYSQYEYCAKANMLVINDLYPNYDGASVPGSAFGSFSGDLSNLNVSTLSNTIFTGEGYSSVLAFIGQSGGVNDGSPTPKTVTGFSNIRGLAPHETNSLGTYYSAAIAYYAWITDVNAVEEMQNIKSFMVGLPSPLPEFRFQVGNQTITVVPFGRSVGPEPTTNPPAQFTVYKAPDKYQPVNNIVDFYITEYTSTRAVFRINFEDVQQGADFDMDAIVIYTIEVINNSQLQVTVTSEYAAGGIIQHMGFVISGSTEDGLYLVVRDVDTSAANDVAYYLDYTPAPLPTNSPPFTKTFTPSANPSAIFFNSPLWYAAKWGGFTDSNGDDTPDVQKEWDVNNDGVPDNFFQVISPTQLQEQLLKAFNLILDRTGSFSSAALSSGFLSTNSYVYQAFFETKQWSGFLLAFKIDPSTGDILTNGSSTNGAEWDASKTLDQQNFNTGRRIVTIKPSSGVGIPFRWPTDPSNPSSSELDISQITLLNLSPTTALDDNQGSNRLNYLRGDRSNEEDNGGLFRNRKSVLGDIIDSAPVPVGPPNAPYPDVWPNGAAENGVTYSSFKQTYANRISMIYLGANDGIMHGFDATNGQEMLGYVPESVYQNLNQLTDPDYAHKFYVDGTVTVVDAFVNSQWRTILVGTLNGGGQGVFALDVTDPSQFAESNATGIVKWEFTDADDADMGLSYSQASIVRLANGQWAAIFGNGYNNTLNDGNASTTGNAVLYIVDLHTGNLIKKLDTGVGASDDPLAQGRPNGLSTPAVVDVNNDLIADIVYVGDIFGNLWKIDISSSNPNEWDFSFKQGTDNAPLYVAINAQNEHQPITIRPTVSRVSFSSSTLQIYIGTGQYLTFADRTDTTVQTVYALRDDNSTPISGRGDLVQQTIFLQANNTRSVSNNLLANNSRGWYLDLIVNGVAEGERIISEMIYINQKLIFTTTIPSEDPCEFGGSGWLMEVDALTGARLNYNVFDINGDGVVNGSDATSYTDGGGDSVTVPVSGIQSEVGLISTPAILNAGKIEYKYLPGTSGGIQKVTESPGSQAFGRQSWRQLQ